MKKGFCLLLCVLIGLACACREPVLPTFESSESAITSSVPASTAAESQPSASVPEGSSDDNSTVTPLTEEEAPETEEEPANVPAVPDLPEPAGFSGFTYPDRTREEIDQAYAFTGFHYLPILTEAPDGFYLSTVTLRRQCYLDKATGDTVVFCGDPVCSHKTPDCAAFYAGVPKWYGGKLYYYVNYDRIQTFLMNPDGSDRREITHFVRESPVQGSLSNAATCICGNYGYGRIRLGVNDDGYGIEAISRSRMEAGAPEEILFTCEYEDWPEAYILSLFGDEKAVWFSTVRYRENAETGRFESASDIYRYDTATGELTSPWRFDHMVGSFFVFDDELWYCPNQQEGETPQIRRVRQDGTDECVIKGDGGMMSCDGVFVYVASAENSGIRIYSLKGVLLANVTPTHLQHWSADTSEHCLYFYEEVSDNDQATLTVEIYDKADIVNGITDHPLVSGITVTFGD